MKAFIFSLILFPFSVFCQNIAFEKVIDDNVSVLEYEVGGQDAYIRYQKVAKDWILRFEDLKLQLYDLEFNRQWQIKFDRITGGTRNYNKFSTAFDDQFIYVMQYNVKIYDPGGEKVKSKLYKIDYEGNIVKQINFQEIEKVEYVQGMCAINNELYVIINRAPFASKSAWNTAKNHHHSIVRLSEDLVQIGKSIELPVTLLDAENSSYWNYDGYADGTFKFRRFYQKNLKGEYTTIISPNNSNSHWFEYIEINEDLEKENYNGGKLEGANVSHYETHLDGVFKYDTSLFKLKYNGVEYTIGDIPFRISFGSSNDLRIHQGEKKSENLINSVHRLVDRNIKNVRSLRITRVISDPINNAINIIAQVQFSTPSTLLFSFDNNLNVTAITEYLESEKVAGRYEFGHAYSYNYGNFKYKKLWGDLEAGRKMNALEYSAKIGVKSQVTIINYDDYQILIVDNKRNRSSRVYKFTR